MTILFPPTIVSHCPPEPLTIHIFWMPIVLVKSHLGNYNSLRNGFVNRNFKAAITGANLKQ